MNTRLGPAAMLAALCLLMLSLSILGTATALADDAADAKTHYQKATGHYAIGEYKEAAAEYEAAYKAKQDPALLYNAAQSHRLANDNQKALLLYKNIVKLYPTSKYAAESKDRIEKLEQAIATTQSPPNQPAPVEGVSSTPTTATAPAPAPAGATAPVQTPPVQPIGQPAAAPPAPSVPPAGASAPPPGATLTATPASDATPIYGKWWFWAGAGAVVVVAVIAVVALSGSTTAWGNVPDVQGRVR
jgi:hypothetical protein